MTMIGKDRFPAAALRMSYFLFACQLATMPMHLALPSTKASGYGAEMLYVLALAWQCVTVWLNRTRVAAWILLFGYVAVPGIPLIAIWIERNSN